MKTVWDVRVGDVLDRLREMPDESVHCVVTSPPYWGLRDYGTAAWDGGDDPACGHKNPARSANGLASSGLEGGQGSNNHQQEAHYRDVCGRCGARRVDQQLGLEATPDCGLWALSPALREQTGLASCGVCYVCRMVAVFREVKRVLRSDGTCFVNMGDTYAHNGAAGGSSPVGDRDYRATDRAKQEQMAYRVPAGLKPKDLIGMPWRLAFALQADGWWLRSEIIWAKPNPMPESVTDRPTKAHEQIFLLTKRGTYFYDSDAIREPAIHAGKFVQTNGNDGMDAGYDGHRTRDGLRRGVVVAEGRNARSVWSIATQPYAEAHFATFPEELPRRCILAGTSERGVCPACGAPWARVVERTPGYTAAIAGLRTFGRVGLDAVKGAGTGGNPATLPPKNTTTGWEPTCAHGGEPPKRGSTVPQRTGGPKTNTPGIRNDTGHGRAGGFYPESPVTTGWDPECSHALEPVPAVVLDPFAGSGTTLMVAVRHGRSAIGIELSPTFAAMARRRILADHGAVEPTNGHTPAEGVQARMVGV